MDKSVAYKLLNFAAQAGVGLLVIDYTFRTKKRIASLLIEKGVLNG